MAEKILITTDSACDLSEELIERFDVKILPLNVYLGNQIYADGVNVNPRVLLKYFDDTKKLPKTTEPTVIASRDFFKKYTAEGYTIIHFTISSALSAAYENAVTAAKMVEGVHVVNTLTASCGQALLVAKAAEMVLYGKSVNEIIKAVEDMKGRVRASFILDQMEFLHAGGRCSGVTKFAAGIFKIKPSIIVSEQGELVPSRKYYGKFETAAKNFISDEFYDPADIDPQYIFLEHCGCEKKFVELCASWIRSIITPEEMCIVHTGCTISAHLGPGTIVVSFLRK